MWDEIADSYDRALDLPPAQREAFLAGHCSDDVRHEVEAMLREHEPLEIESELLAVSDATLAEGTRIGSYRVKSWIGQGGMGEVYLAARVDAGFEQLVAIKVLRVPYGGRDAAARFRRERRILAHLAHPAVVPLLDSGVTSDGRPYLVLQYVEGLPITRYCDEKKLSVDARLRLFVDVCRAVQYAHGRLIIHRDLKPSNILVTPEGEPRLLDFGIAKVLASEGDDPETQVTHLQGAPMTPERAAPEQLRGELSSTATDVWALGVLLYELVKGKLPFAVTGRSREEIERAVTAEPEPMRLRLRGDLDTVVAVALRLEPDQRYASAGQLADDVERVLAGQPILARPHGLGYRVRRFVGRNHAAVAASTLAFVCLIAFSVASIVQARQVIRERDRAAAEEVKANAVVDLLVEVLGGAAPTAGARGAVVNVDELLARGEKRARDLDGQPEIQARLWHVLGKIQLDRSGLRKARELFELAYAREAAVAGAGAARSLEMALDLANAEQKLGNNPAAEKILRGIIARVERDGGGPEIHANALNQLGTLVKDEPLLQRALGLRRAIAPPKPMLVADTLNELGTLAYEAGVRDTAERYWRESLALATAALGADHPQVLSVKSHLSLVVSDDAEQEALFRSLIASHETRFGRNSSEAALAWNNMGVAMARRGNLAGALAAFRESVDRWTIIAGRDHPHTLNTRRSIGRIFELTGDHESALRHLQAVIAVLRRRGTEEAFLAGVRSQAAMVLLRVGRPAEAEREASLALAELKRLAPETASARIGAQLIHGTILLARGRAAEAEAELRPLVPLLAAVHPAGDPRIAEAQVMLARAVIARGRVGEGRAILEKHLPVFAGYGLAHPDDVAAAQRAMSGSAP